MAPYGLGGSCWLTDEPIRGKIPSWQVVPAHYLRGVRILSTRSHGSIMEVCTSAGDRYFIERDDFELARMNGYWDEPGACQQQAPAPPRTQTPQPVANATTATKKTPAAEKNSLKRVYYHNRLRKKT